MRAYVVLIIFAAAMSFISGYYALFIQGDPAATPDNIRELNFIKRKFIRDVRYKKILNLEEIYPSLAQVSLYRPITNFDSRPEMDKSTYSTSMDCFSNIQGLINFGDYEKAYMWEEFRCGKKKYINPDFLTTPPYMHPSGLSYAYLIFLASDTHDLSSQEIEHILQFFHVSELRYVKKKLGKLPGLFNILADLEDYASMELTNGANAIMGNHVFLFKKSDYFRSGAPSYYVYRNKDVAKFLHHSRYSVSSASIDKNCFYKDEGLCWELKFKDKLKLIPSHNIVLLLISIFVTILVFWLLLKRINAQKLEDSQRRLALQVLSHEFRTPVASSMIAVENLSKKIDQLDEDGQEDLLRLAGSTYRMQRLTEMSRNYLRVEPRRGLIHLQPTKLESINDFIEQIVDPYMDDINVQFSQDDFSFVLDEYWTHICVKNLIENALRHGAKPVCLTVNYKAGCVEFCVEDSGEMSECDLKVLTAAFYKGNKSEGSGLGLNIVKKVVQAMGGELLLNTNPTQFIIKLKELK